MTVPTTSKIQEILAKKVPILTWLPFYSWSKFFQDALAGLTVGLTAIPQGIAYAAVAGLDPQYGLYSGFMGCFVYLILGTSKDVTVGPTAIMALLIQPYVSKFGAPIAVLMCFLSGCVITIMGIFHIGFLVDFISMPVICGFSNAAALIIAASQFGTLFGIQGRTETFSEAIIKVVTKINEIEIWDTLLGTICMLILVGLKNLPGNKIGNLNQKIMWILSLGRNAIVVIIGTVLAYWFSKYDMKPFTITGNITEGLPSFNFPPFSIEALDDHYNYSFLELTKILGASLVSVPLIAILESIAIAKAFAKGRSLDANQEMLALGFSNIFSSFFQSMPVTGSFTRTAVNHASGVKTPMGGIVTGSLILLACGLLTSIFKFIPKSSLAAVIIVAMSYMLELKVFLILWRTKKIDLLPLIATLSFCLVFGLEYGMVIGIAINLLLLLYFTARPGLMISEKNINNINILLVSPAQSLSFPAAEYLRESVMNWCDGRQLTIPVFIDGSCIQRIDATVAKNLRLLQLDLEARNQKLIFLNWCEATKRTLTSYDENLASSFEQSDILSERPLIWKETCQQIKNKSVEEQEEKKNEPGS